MYIYTVLRKIDVFVVHLPLCNMLFFEKSWTFRLFGKSWTFRFSERSWTFRLFEKSRSFNERLHFSTFCQKYHFVCLDNAEYVIRDRRPPTPSSSIEENCLSYSWMHGPSCHYMSQITLIRSRGQTKMCSMVHTMWKL